VAGIVTLLFTDLVGSTELLERLGDDEAERLRREHFRLLRDAITANGGREVKSLGDGLMVVFEGATNALSCAMAMQRAVHRYAQRSGVTLGVRIGIEAGEPMHEGDDFFGTPVVVAKRLCDAAAGGGILVSELLRGLVGTRGGFALREVGPLELHGLEEPVRAWQLEWEPEAAAPMELPSALAMSGRTPFVGRDAELERLLDRWKLARAHAPGIALVSGEPGIGKTRLCAEFGRRAHDEGALVLYGRCDEEPLLPYQPFVEAMRRYVGAAAPGELRHQAGPRAALLSRLLPDLGERLPGLAEVPHADPQTDRLRLFDAVTGFLAEIAHGTTLVVVLDDLHWADHSTVSLLRHVLRRLDPCPLLLCGTYRDTELGRKHPFAGFLADLAREATGERTALRGLDADQVATLLERTAGHDVGRRGRRLADALHGATEGNPFFIEQALGHLIETGRVYQQDGVWTFDERIEHLGIPEGVREAIGRRLSRLSDDCDEVLTHASVLGRDFDFDVLAKIVPIHEDATVRALEDALAAGLLTEIAGATPRYAFAHALVQETLYEELSLPRKQRLHLRAAEAIEILYGAALGERVRTLAVHFRLAGQAADADRAIECSIQAGAAAQDVSAFEEAAVHWESALELMEQHDADPERRARLLDRLGDLEFMKGTDVEKAVAYRERALELYERIGMGERAAQIHSRIGAHLSTIGAARELDIARALEHFAAAEPVLAAGAQRPALGYFYMGYANALMRALRIPEATDASRRAMELGERLGSEVLWGHGALLQGWALWESGSFAAGQSLVERAYETAVRLNHAVLALLASWNRGNNALWLDDPADAVEWYGRELGGARLVEAPGSRQLLLYQLAGALHGCGRIEDAKRAHEEAGGEGAPWVFGWSGDADLATALGQVVAAIQQSARTGDRWGAMWFGRWAATWLRALGDHSGAERMSEEHLATAIEAGNVPAEMRHRANLALIYGETGRPGRADEHLERCEHHLRGGEDWKGLEGKVALAEAVVAAARGLADDADACFAHAVSILRRYFVWGEAEALHLWGRTLRDAGEPARAREKLEAAVEIYVARGAGRQVVDAVRADFPSRPAAK
jgi:class 3 adenylate cyclase/tetratricopeptide (TPR) repeat protein